MNLEEYHTMSYDDVDRVFIVEMEETTVAVPYEVVISMLELKLDI